jgi:transposase
MARLTARERRQVSIDYQKMPVKDVLTKHGISRRTLYKIVGEKKRGARPRKVDDRLTSIIVTMRLRGRSDHEIAKLTGLSQDTVTRIRNRLGYKPLTRNRD